MPSGSAPPAARHGAPLAPRCPLRCQSGASALLHFRRKVVHGLLCDDPPLATGKGSIGLIDCSKDLRASAFALFPQGKRFPRRFFFVLQAATLNSVADKRLLVRGELNVHGLRLRESSPRSNTRTKARFTATEESTASP